MSDDWRTLDEAIAEGAIVALPDEHAVLDHPGSPGLVTYVVAEPFDIGDPHGRSRHVEPGDVLHAAEAAHSGPALSRLVRQGKVFAIPSDRGLVGFVAALLSKVDRLEQLLADLHGARPEA
jgi:hypothetical protein